MHRYGIQGPAAWLSVGVILAGGVGQAGATTVAYSVANVAGDNWNYSYALSNDTLASAIREVSIYFDPASFANLAITSAPAGWDTIIIQPDPGLPAAGFADILALPGGLAPGATLGGLAISFTYLGTGTPGSQSFDVVDPESFATLASGTTSAVPLPGGFWFVATATGALLLRARRRREAT
ncbi:MAG: hypothetical protein ABIX37_07555 [Gammaproteobacteria bacterium]